jgi:membrane-bound acyltransferase YfiQ involved in biofilm formation
VENKILEEHAAYIFLSYNFFISVYGKALKMKKQRKSTKEALISRFIENHYNGDVFRKFMVCELHHKEIITFS